ncbi:MAG: amino acid ABC transporter permease [Candidatus Zeuxoniibacter abyssi]|nr:MAG: amino acid ABC transporter permease [Candidatus Persebacteraceae bacterium AB1(2)]
MDYLLSLWRNPRARGVIYQVTIFLLLVIFVWWVADNTAANLAKQGKASGFGFLDDTAGFSINFHLIDYKETSPFIDVFVIGILNTLLVSFLAIFFATVLGFLVGVGRLSSNLLVRWLCTAYVELFRNIPLLLQIFFWYFAILSPLPNPKQSITFLAETSFLNNRGLYMPQPLFEDGFGFVFAAIIIVSVGAFFLQAWAKKRQEQTGEQFPVFSTFLAAFIFIPLVIFFIVGSPLSWELPIHKGFNIVKGTGMWLPPEFVALLLALSIYTASFIAEVVRAGILSVSHGQTEAASAVGLKQGLVLRLVLIPQSLRVIIPPLTNQYLNLTKNSSLAIAIAYPEIVSVFTGTSLNQTGQEIEIIFMTMMFYLSVCLLIALFMNWYNKRTALIKER